MTGYRRWRVGGGTYFFTVCLARRGSDLLVREIALLREAVGRTRAECGFEIDTCVVLPDHLHCIWRLPQGDYDFSTRWGAIKARFTRAVRASGRMGLNPILRPPSKARKGEAGLWQRRFWEHLIRDEADLALHREICWIDPVRHGLVRRVCDWPQSSFHREVRLGRVREDWEGSFTAVHFGDPVMGHARQFQPARRDAPDKPWHDDTKGEAARVPVNAPRPSWPPAPRPPPAARPDAPPGGRRPP